MERVIIGLEKFSEISQKRIKDLPFFSFDDVICTEDDGYYFSLVYGSDSKSLLKLTDDSQVMHYAIFEHPHLTYLFIQFRHKKGCFTGDVNGTFGVASDYRGHDISSSLIEMTEEIAKDLGGQTINYHGFKLDMQMPLIMAGYKDVGMYRGFPRLAKLLSVE